jgi:outer membrane murein-binding lipoprotein Lpp
MPNGNGNGELKFTRGEWIRLAGLIFAITVFVVGGIVSLASWYGGSSVKLDVVTKQVSTIEGKVDSIEKNVGAVAHDVALINQKVDQHLADSRGKK